MYEVTITTADISYAASDSNFYYTFTGTEGETEEYLANAPDSDDRQLGETDTWTFNDGADIGRFLCIRIRMDGADGWFFNSVGQMI